MAKTTELLWKLFSRIKLVFTRHWAESFSQEGEDMILRKIFEHKQNGFFIDIGAHHPWKFSNTYYFYKRGWRGINVDALPGSMAAFNKTRPEDINIEAGVSGVKGELFFYKFEEPAINTFDEALAQERIKENKYRFIEKVKVNILTFAEILDNHLPAGQRIDFLSVDVENLDYDVLRSNNWAKYIPDYILVESLGAGSIPELVNEKVYLFLNEKNYSLIAKTMNTCIYKNKLVK